ncbi:MAG TPA: signal peptidase I [Nanoarchaeota archaeon]|nr:signal peptidase I [Nanoarchaeota archaeon]
MKAKIIALLAVMLFAGIFLIAYSFSTEAAETYTAVLAPSDTVSESQIKVYDNKIIIEIPNARWASYTNTKSMSPVLDEGSNGIEIVPRSISEIHVGDIIAYETKWNNIPVVHRVIGIKKDSIGAYFVLKGDNNMKADAEKVRFSQVKYKLIAVVY